MEKKTLFDYYGILSEEAGESMLKLLDERRKYNLTNKKKRFKELYGEGF
jgi:hypothetical protein